MSLLHPCASRPVPRGCLQGLLAVNNEPLRSHGGVPCPAAFKPPPVTTAWETTGGPSRKRQHAAAMEQRLATKREGNAKAITLVARADTIGVLPGQSPVHFIHRR